MDQPKGRATEKRKREDKTRQEKKKEKEETKNGGKCASTSF